MKGRELVRLFVLYSIRNRKLTSLFLSSKLANPVNALLRHQIIKIFQQWGKQCLYAEPAG
jgi:hypothetical protein